MKNTFITGVFILVSNTTFALELNCVTTQPCLHESQLNYCLKGAKYFKINEKGAEISTTNKKLLKLKEIKMSKDRSEIIISDMIDGQYIGENYIHLKRNRIGDYTGTLTLEEDFEFKIVCRDLRTVIYEPRTGISN